MGLFGGGKAADDDKDIQISRLMSEKQELETRIDSLDALNKKYQDNARAFEEEADSIRQQLLSQVKKTERAQDEIVHLNDSIRELQGELSRLKNTVDPTENEALQEKIKDLNAEITKLEVELAETRDENAKLASTTASSNSSEAMKALKENNAKLVGFLTNAKKMVLDYKEREKQWNNEKTKVKEVIIRLKSELEDEKAKSGTASADIQAELDKTKAALETATLELENLKKEKAAHKGARENLEQELAATKAALGAMKTERDNLQNDFMALKSKLSSLLG